MSQQAFDAFTRRATEGFTRRSSLGTLGVASLAALAAGSLTAEAKSKSKNKKAKKLKKKLKQANQKCPDQAEVCRTVIAGLGGNPEEIKCCDSLAICDFAPFIPCVNAA